jgi:hypothetical protein
MVTRLTVFAIQITFVAGAGVPFSSLSRPDRHWGPPNLLSNGYQELFSPGVKRSVREAGHSPSSNSRLRMRSAISPLPVRL